MTLSLHLGRPTPQAAPRNLCVLRVSALDFSRFGSILDFQSEVTKISRSKIPDGSGPEIPTGSGLSTFNCVFFSPSSPHLCALCGENSPSFRSSLTPRHSPLTTNSFTIRTSKTPLPQLLYNPHLQAPLGSAGNKGLITPLESALTKNSPVTSLESALTKTPGVGVGYGDSFTPMTSTDPPRLTSSPSVPLRWSVLGATIGHSQAQALPVRETSPLLPVSKNRERTWFPVTAKRSTGIARRCPRLAVYPDLLGAVPGRAGRPAHQHRVGKAGSVRLG